MEMLTSAVFAWLLAVLLSGPAAGFAIGPGRDPCEYPINCPGKAFPRKDKQTWMMNASTIIMPCNNTGFTDPASTAGWGIVDFDWSNSKGTGNAAGWAKNDHRGHQRNDGVG